MAERFRTKDVGQQRFQKIRLSRGEIMEIQGDKEVVDQVSCEDIAMFALALYENQTFFSIHRDLSIRLDRDINGSGVQRLDVKTTDDEIRSESLIMVLFDYGYGDDSFLYEADLIVDQRKDYEPTVNRGTHRFYASLVEMRLDWTGCHARKWREDVVRLSQPHDTLVEWMDSGLGMFVKCRDSLCGRNATFVREDLAKHVADGRSLKDLQNRLRCSECGKRKPYVSVF